MSRWFIGLLAVLWTACASPLHHQTPPVCDGPWKVSPGSPSGHSETSRLKFLTYNIRVGAGTGRPFTTVKRLPSSGEALEKIARAISSVGPDVAALQEVRGLDQARFLAEKLQMNYVYCAHGRRDLDWGLALLSRFEISALRSELIHPGRDPRIALVCTVKAPQGDILCLNLHYHPYGGYPDQVDRTMALLRGLEGPVVLMGDLNFSGLHGALNPIRDRMSDTCDVARSGTEIVREKGTVSGGLPYQLDHIFVDPPSFRVEAVGLVAEAFREASDHMGYYACVEPL